MKSAATATTTTTSTTTTTLVLIHILNSSSFENNLEETDRRMDGWTDTTSFMNGKRKNANKKLTFFEVKVALPIQQIKTRVIGTVTSILKKVSFSFMSNTCEMTLKQA